MARRAKEKMAEEITEKVLEQVKPESKSANKSAQLPRSLRKKLWNLAESTITWGAITVLLLAIGSALSLSTLYVFAWLLGTAALLKQDFFESKSATKSAFGNAFLCLVLALALLGLWRTFPKPREVPTAKQIANEVYNILPTWLRYPPKIIPPLEDPVVHIEPENSLIWSTGPNEKQGTFRLTFANTGREDIEKIEANYDYFIAEGTGSAVMFKILPHASALIPRLNAKQRVPITIDFTKFEDTAREVMTAFDGPSLLGVRILASFRRRADGKSYSFTSVYAALNPTAPGIYTVGSEWDRASGFGAMGIFSDGHNWFTDSINAGVGTVAINKGKPSLTEIAPYMQSRERWVPVVREISSDSTGKQKITVY